MFFLVVLGWSWLVLPSEAECYEDGRHLTCRENDSFPNTSLPLVEIVNWAASAAGPGLKDLRDLVPNLKVVARSLGFNSSLLGNEWLTYNNFLLPERVLYWERSGVLLGGHVKVSLSVLGGLPNLVLGDDHCRRFPDRGLVAWLINAISLLSFRISGQKLILASFRLLGSFGLPLIRLILTPVVLFLFRW